MHYLQLGTHKEFLNFGMIYLNFTDYNLMHALIITVLSSEQVEKTKALTP